MTTYTILIHAYSIFCCVHIQCIAASYLEVPSEGQPEFTEASLTPSSSELDGICVGPSEIALWSTKAQTPCATSTCSFLTKLLGEL